MRKAWSLFLGVLFTTGTVTAQSDSLKIKYAQTINADQLKSHLKVLASDEYEGRETGEPGQKKAAEYISEHFKKLGFPAVNDGSYYQTIPMRLLDPSGVTVETAAKKYAFLEDFYFFPGFTDQVIETEEITFMGFGIETDKYSDYASADVNGKVLMVLDQEPKDKKGTYYATNETTVSEWTWNWRIKTELATKKGAAALLIVVKDMDRRLDRIKGYLGQPSLEVVSDEEKETGIPVLYISESMAAEMMAASKKRPDKLRSSIEKKGKTVSFVMAGKVKLNINRAATEITSENVLGYIEGTDLKDELVIITAHYDHLGIKGDDIYNGADDDGSGTVAVLELAEAFAKAKADGNGPRRSILIMPVSGEEKGLLGSEYYTDHPIFPLEKTVADLNIDMIGREDKKHEENMNYVYLIGSDKLSTELHNISDRANEDYTNLELDYTYNDPEDPNRFYYRSDHYNFAKNNIPVIFYFCGTHDDYHQPTDTYDKINYVKMEKITRLVFYTAWELANRDDRIIVDKKPEVEDEH